MRILLLAPHPFYEERGTPIAVDLLVRVFSERGDAVTLLTYHLGLERSYPGVTIRRIRRLRRITRVRPGFSIRKLACDWYLLREAWRLARDHRYDLIHAVEESVFIALLLRRSFGVPYVYDMDSSMPHQIVEKHAWARFLLPFMKWTEAAAIRRAEAVVPVCDSLAQRALACGARRITTLRDISLLPLLAGDAGQEPGLPAVKGTTFMYIGNLEPYQGIGLLVRSFAAAVREIRDVNLIVVGGNPQDIASYGRLARELGVEKQVFFVGPRPLSMMGRLFQSADVLVSPRTQGENTPMKIYSYLDSGRPVLATRLPTHTQVMNDNVALLEAPEPESFARGMVRLARDPELRHRLAESAKRVSSERYSFEAYRRTLTSLYESLEAGVRLRRTSS